MSNKDNTFIVNETTNKWLSNIQDKQFIYRVLYSTLPRIKYKKVAYIKKQAKSDVDKTSDIKSISNAQELSSREISEYYNLLNLLKL